MWIVKFVLRRLVSLLPVLLGISLVAFFSIRLIPGGPAAGILGANYNEEAAAAINARLGLDRPWWEQMFSWYLNLFQGDLGTSMLSSSPVTSEIGRHLMKTVELASLALLISLVVAIPLGILAAQKEGSLLDFLARSGSVVGISVPSFVVGVVLILLFSLQWTIFPTGGAPPVGSPPWERLQYVIMPAVALSLGTMAIVLKMMRSSYLQVQSSDHVRTAWAKGLRRRDVVSGHIVRNSLLPVVTIVAMEVGFMIGGAVVIEMVFSWPGMGSLLINSILFRDYTVVQGCVIVIAVAFVLANLLADIVLSILDPRLRER